jgi:hypothetical protein
LFVVDPDNIYPDDFTLTVEDGANYSRLGNAIVPASHFVGTLTVPVTVDDGRKVQVLGWDANNEPNVTAYKLYYKKGVSGNGVLAEYDGSGLIYAGVPYEGQAVNSGFMIYKSDLPDPNASTVECGLRGFSPGEVYYFVVTAINDEDLESTPSNEIATILVTQSNKFRFLT